MTSSIVEKIWNDFVKSGQTEKEYKSADEIFKCNPTLMLTVIDGIQENHDSKILLIGAIEEEIYSRYIKNKSVIEGSCKLPY